MDIYVKTISGKIVTIGVDPSDSIQDLKEKIQEKEGIPPEQQSIIFTESNKNSKELEDKTKLSDYGINKGSTIYMFHRLDSGSIIKKDDSKEKINDFFKNYDKLFVKNELLVNLIYYCSDLKSKENYTYYNLFKVDVVGEYYAIDDLEIFKKCLDKIESKKTPFIIITTGSNGKEILPLCKKCSFIKEVIIFCRIYNYNKHYIKEYPKLVKKVLISSNELFEYLSSLDKSKLIKEKDNSVFFPEDIKMEKKFLQPPIITAMEYDKKYFVLHKAYSHFFGDMDSEDDYPEFTYENIGEIINYLNSIPNMKIEKNLNCFNLLLNQICSFYGVNDYEPFVEKAIKYYLDEGVFFYLFNTLISNFEKDLKEYSYFMGPFLFRLNKYVKRNNNFSFEKDMQLFKFFMCSDLDFLTYKLNLGHIICFPSLLLTSSVQPNDFEPNDFDSNYRKDKNVNCEFIFNYKHEKDNISPGIVIEDNTTRCGDTLSIKGEKEIILFPFTFAKITSIELTEIRENLVQVINLEIINRKSFLEYDLKNNVDKRILFSKLEKNEKK